MESNRLKLNPEVTEFIRIASSGRNIFINQSSIVGNGNNIKSSSIVRLQSVHIDDVTSFEAHIGNVVNMCLFQFRQLKAVRNCIPLETAGSLVNSFVATRLDYCNNILAGVLSSYLDRLQSSVFNASATIIYHASEYDYNTSLLRDNLHWLRC